MERNIKSIREGIQEQVFVAAEVPHFLFCFYSRSTFFLNEKFIDVLWGHLTAFHLIIHHVAVGMY